MIEARQPIERLQKLMGQLLAGVPAEELKKMHTQFDVLESRVTKEEANRMERLLRDVISVENLEKCLGKK
jgi:hypothetical protein